MHGFKAAQNSPNFPRYTSSMLFHAVRIFFLKQILSDILLLPRSLTKLALEYVCLLKHNFLIQSHDNGEYQDGDQWPLRPGPRVWGIGMAFVGQQMFFLKRRSRDRL